MLKLHLHGPIDETRRKRVSPDARPRNRRHRRTAGRMKRRDASADRASESRLPDQPVTRRPRRRRDDSGGRAGRRRRFRPCQALRHRRSSPSDENCRRVWKSSPKNGTSPDSARIGGSPSVLGAQPSYLRFQTSMPTSGDSASRSSSAPGLPSLRVGKNRGPPPWRAASASSSSVGPRFAEKRKVAPNRDMNQVRPIRVLDARHQQCPPALAAVQACVIGAPAVLVEAAIVLRHQHRADSPDCRTPMPGPRGPASVVGPVGMNVDGCPKS